MIDHTSPAWTEADQAASEPDFYGKWVSVDKNLPANAVRYGEEEDDVTKHPVIVLCMHGLIGTAYRNNAGTWINLAQPRFTIGIVTHWMEMPEPPKETNQ